MMFLDAAALRRLTGYAHAPKQIEQLRAMGVPFWINGRGQPVVACSALDGSPKAPAAASSTGWQPAVLSTR